MEDEVVEAFENDLCDLLDAYPELTVHELIDSLHLAVSALVVQELEDAA